LLYALHFKKVAKLLKQTFKSEIYFSGHNKDLQYGIRPSQGNLKQFFMATFAKIMRLQVQGKTQLLLKK